jgi:hypothetical protein
MLTIKKVAEGLDGVEIGKERERFNEAELKEAGIVVVYGGSDDLMEFRGAIHDEVGCYDGGLAFLTEDDLLSFNDDCGGEWDECPYFRKEQQKAKKIKAVWCAPGEPAWIYKTDIPHETFNVIEDGEVWCEGIVFSMDEF